MDDADAPKIHPDHKMATTSSDNFRFTRVVRRYTVALKDADTAKGPLRTSPRFGPRSSMCNSDDVDPLILPPGLYDTGLEDGAVVSLALRRRRLRRIKFCHNLRQLAQLQQLD